MTRFYELSINVIDYIPYQNDWKKGERNKDFSSLLTSLLSVSFLFGSSYLSPQVVLPDGETRIF